MGAFFDLVAASAALKELYDGQKIQNLVYKKNATLALMPKNTEFYGKYKPITVQIGVSQGRSANFANAQGNQSAAQFVEFLLTRKKDYSIATLDNETMKASSSDKGSFLRGAKIVVDAAWQTITNSLGSGVLRSGTGTIAQIASVSNSGTTYTVTLTNAADIVQIENNMTLVASTSDGGAASTDAFLVTSVNRIAGSFTFTSGSAPSAGWAANSFVSVQGDTNAKITGIEGWIPFTDPASNDSFYNVNRSVDRVRLAGLPYDGSSQSIEEALIDASAQLNLQGGSPDYFMTNFLSFAALEKSLGSKVQYVTLNGPANIGFKGIVINTGEGEVKVMADRNCPSKKGYLLQMDTWCLESLGEAPEVQTYRDGLEMLRLTSGDAAELRIAYYANVSCNAPGWNANVKLGA